MTTTEKLQALLPEMDAIDLELRSLNARRDMLSGNPLQTELDDIAVGYLKNQKKGLALRERALKIRREAGHAV